MDKKSIISMVKREFSDLPPESQVKIARFIRDINKLAAKNTLDCDGTFYDDKCHKDLGYDVFYINGRPAYL